MPMPLDTCTHSIYSGLCQGSRHATSTMSVFILSHRSYRHTSKPVDEFNPIPASASARHYGDKTGLAYARCATRSQ
jgi:hypothetical protein